LIIVTIGREVSIGDPRPQGIQGKDSPELRGILRGLAPSEEPFTGDGVRSDSYTARIIIKIKRNASFDFFRWFLNF